MAKKIIITDHMLERFNSRFDMKLKRTEIQGIIKNRIQVINRTPVGKISKVSFTLRHNEFNIPVIAVIRKTNNNIYLLTCYVNHKKPIGKTYIKLIKEKKGIPWWQK